jgi:hypothetical protein
MSGSFADWGRSDRLSKLRQPGYNPQYVRLPGLQTMERVIANLLLLGLSFTSRRNFACNTWWL